MAATRANSNLLGEIASVRTFYARFLLEFLLFRPFRPVFGHDGPVSHSLRPRNWKIVGTALVEGHDTAQMQRKWVFKRWLAERIWVPDRVIWLFTPKIFVSFHRIGYGSEANL